MTSTEAPGDSELKKQVEVLEEAVIRFAGDSGDGMQLTGTQFTNTAALVGNDLATFPDYPAEIRAPAGTLPGVSAFQLRFASQDIHTPGDKLDVLVAMNPAALRVHLEDLKKGGVLIANAGMFRPKELRLAGFKADPLEDPGLLSDYRVIPVDLNELTKETLQDSGLDARAMLRCKNMAALGVLFWLFNRSIEPTIEEITRKFQKQPGIAEANIKVLKAGYYYGETVELLQHTFRIEKADLPRGTYRNVTGNEAVGLGLVAASKLTGLELFLGSYPITPASEILHMLSEYKQDGVITFQCEDEIAAICSAIGAAYAGKLGATTSSGPGIALKSEAIGLAVMTELPIVVVNVQRGGPSTGLPTKTEQADLLQAVYGRNGECPVPVLAAASPADCFGMTLEAFRIALKYMTPVMLLTDGYLANGSEPWLLPKPGELPEISVKFKTEGEDFKPYDRDPESLVRPWVVPGTPNLMHRIGGLEKDESGNPSYDPENHFKMVKIRHAKVEGIAKDIAQPEFYGDQDGGDVLILGWGSTYGAICGAVNKLRRDGFKVSRIQLRHIFPLHPSLDGTFGRFGRILLPEMNMGQVKTVLINLVPGHEYVGLNKVTGRPFTQDEIAEKARELIR